MPRKTSKKKSGGPAKQQSKSVAAAVEETPPKPPPPPPAALVKLIQKNKSVLKYFQALQENLDYDVTKWKRRARKSQAESLEWKAKAEQLDAERGSASASTGSKKRPPDQIQHDEDRERPQRQRLRTENPSGMEKSPETNSGKANETNSNVASKASSASDKELSSKKMDTQPAAEDEDWLDFASMSSEDAEENGNESPKNTTSLQNEKAAPPLNILALSSEDSDEEEEDEKNEPSSRQSSQKRAPLHILALSSDDTDDDDEDDDEYSTGWLESQFSENQKQDSPNQKVQKLRNNQALQSLQKANDLLSELGIILVEEKTISQEDQNDEDQEKELSDSQVEAPQSKVILQRREDSCVLTDLLQSIKALVRIHEDAKKKGEEPVESYYPFMTKDLIPCFMVHQESPDTTFCPHPAVEGMLSLSEVFRLMEIHCPILDEIDEDDLAGHDRLILGMKDRHTMVLNLVRSLEGEICELWPVQDRATRLMTGSLHFEPIDHDEESQQISMNEHKIAAPTKNFSRLAALMERCFLAQFVSRMHLARQDPRGFFQFFWRYLMATTPSIAINSTPFKLPPVQSTCVLESILCSGSLDAHDILKSHLSRHKEGDWKWISQTICILVEATGMIQLSRSKSEDDRIADTARVELAAKTRLEANHPFWEPYSSPLEKDRNGLEEISEVLQTMVKDLGRAMKNDAISSTLQPMLLQALLVTSGDVKSIDNLFASSLKKSEENENLVLACVKAKKALEIRMIEKHRQVVLSPSTLAMGGMRLWDYSKETFKAFEQFCKNDKDGRGMAIELAMLSLATCLEMADGESALKILEACLNRLDSTAPLLPSALNLMESVGQAIVVRVINLERRPDRLASFLAQAAHSNLLVMRAVMDIGKRTGTGTGTGEESAGTRQFCYAFDGGNGRPAEIEARFAQRLGTQDDDDDEISQQLVQSHWRPNDLQVFDSEAPDSLDETRISPSEKACALSHIASWKGVVQSLELMEGSGISNESSLMQKDNDSIFRNPSHWRQKFQISGYARGPPLFPENEGMPPTPVCIILEDDAILVDRFQDRLFGVLNELPRDFHFCSIGYSRPKTAPLIPFSSEISIPSCIWYLTGYIISLKGCRYLMNQLPVRGPVDSWIGLELFKNWDNMYGHDLGVGTPTKKATTTTAEGNKATATPTISRKDLRKVLKFRAFCAIVPLCSQKVGLGGGCGTSGGTRTSTGKSNVRNWRNRDTDIVYSGNSI